MHAQPSETITRGARGAVEHIMDPQDSSAWRLLTHDACVLCMRAQEFVSGDGFGLPSPVPDMVVMGKTLPEAAAKWKDILFTTGARAGDYLTGNWPLEHKRDVHAGVHVCGAVGV